MSDTKKVRLTINGKEVLSEAGKSLLQAAIEAGIQIPHFCYHPGIGIEGSCRLCLVEIEGVAKLQTSCTVPVKEGLVVSSESETVRTARKGVLEFFLINHPLDCPICDKGGECPLQNYALDAGQSYSRFEFDKIEKGKHQVIGEHIVLDTERCVLCNRCVRFLRNLTGREELQIRNRGVHSEIFVPEGASLTSGFTGNLADICPVGSLTTREFRFRARPWELKTIDTICGECSLGCNVQAWKKETQLLRVTPRIEPEVNEYWLCDRGRFSLHHRITPDRLTAAHKPGNGATLASPAQVASMIADEIRGVPRGDMAFVAESSLTNEEFFRLKKLAAAAGGKVYAPLSTEAVELARKLAGEGLSGGFPGKLEQAKTVLLLGERVEEEHPVLALRLRRLYHAYQIRLLTFGGARRGFEDIRASHTEVAGDPESVQSLFEKLSKGGRADEFTYVFLTDRWVDSATLPAILRCLDEARGAGGPRLSVSLLWNGANAAGLAAQWDSAVHPTAELEADIQRGKVQGVLWFGEVRGGTVFDEYLRGMRVFVQAVHRLAEAHPRARWVLPLESGLEKKGTYLNTFGRVQTVRRTVRLIEKGYEPMSMLRLIRQKLGVEDTLSVEQVYEELAKEFGYPKTLGEIPESKQTYDHYARALWR
ncbi:MAG: 2Fe-2S iron-sulfur cluster-binding protein [Pseudomonadota bacterium]